MNFHEMFSREKSHENKLYGMLCVVLIKERFFGKKKGRIVSDLTSFCVIYSWSPWGILKL